MSFLLCPFISFSPIFFVVVHFSVFNDRMDRARYGRRSEQVLKEREKMKNSRRRNSPLSYCGRLCLVTNAAVVSATAGIVATRPMQVKEKCAVRFY